MNLTINLNEQRVDKATNKPCGGLSTFEDIRSLKVEYSPSGFIGYKVELILFLGDKYNKQLITLDNVERVVACGLCGLIHAAAYNRHGTITNKETNSDNLPKPTYEYEESYMEPTNLGVDIMANKYREIKHTTINIYNDMEKVDINILYKVLDSSNGAKTESEKKIKFIESGEFKFGKLKNKESESENEYTEKWSEIFWRNENESSGLDTFTTSDLIQYLAYPSRFKRNFNTITCTKIWRILGSEVDQLSSAVFDRDIDYVYEISLVIKNESDWHLFLAELREYIRGIKQIDKNTEIMKYTKGKTKDGEDAVFIRIRREKEL